MKIRNLGFLKCETVKVGIKLSEQNIYSNNRFQIREERGSTHWVEWVPI